MLNYWKRDQEEPENDLKYGTQPVFTDSIGKWKRPANTFNGDGTFPVRTILFCPMYHGQTTAILWNGSEK